MDNFLDMKTDRAFNEALDLFIRIDGLSILRFCDWTRNFSPNDRQLILPTQVSKWRRDQMPSARAAMITAAALDVPRSFFYLVGELLLRGEDPEHVEERITRQFEVLLKDVGAKLRAEQPDVEPDEAEKLTRQYQVLLNAVEEMDGKALEIFDEAIRKRRSQIEEEHEEEND